MAIPESFLKKLAAKVGVSEGAYGAFAQFMNRWQPYEGGHTNNNATWNYLNTTQDMGDNAAINSVGVRAYGSEEQGVDATAKTLLNGRYENLVQAFRTGDYSDVGSISGDVRVWTSGSREGGSNFADSIVGLGQAPDRGSTGGGGEQPAPGEVAERFYDDPELDGRYDQVRKAYFAAYEKWVGAGRPQPWIMDDESGELVPNRNDPVAFEFASAQEDINAFTETFGFPDNRQNGTDSAQQAFENSINLGDYELRRADAAYQRWLNRMDAASQGARDELDAAVAQNESAATSLEDYRASNFTAPPRSTSVRLIQPYDQVFDKWKSKLGVGEEPGMEAGASGLQMPAASSTRRATADTLGGFGGTPDRTSGNPAGNPFSLFGSPRVPTDWSDSGPAPSNQQEYTGQGPFDVRRPAASGSASGGANRSASRTFGGNIPMPSAKGAKETARKWWQKIPGFAHGVQGFAGGEAMLGEQGEEIVEIPGFGEFSVGANGPEVRNLPPGSNVIPMNEKLIYSQIQEAARQGRAPDRMKKQQEAMQRRQDPMVQENVQAAIQRAMATQMAVAPPKTPRLVGEWTEPDPWAAYRELSGVPAVDQPAQIGAKPQPQAVQR